VHKGKHEKAPVDFLIVLACLERLPVEKPAKAITGSVVSVTSGSYLNLAPSELNMMLDNKDFVFFVRTSPIK